MTSHQIPHRSTREIVEDFIKQLEKLLETNPDDKSLKHLIQSLKRLLE